MPGIKFFETADAVNPGDLYGSRAVVIDVLRATSTIVTALFHGARDVIPVKKVNEAFRIASTLPHNQVVIGGERKGVAVEGFQCGNSPLEYNFKLVAGKTIVMTTTNGTRALMNAAHADEVLVLAFLNLGAIVDYVANKSLDIAVIAAGDNGSFSLEDSVCAGLFIKRLMEQSEQQFSIGLDIRSLVDRASDYEHDLIRLFLDSPHGRSLSKLGYEKDLGFCATVDRYSIVPYYREGRIKPFMPLENKENIHLMKS